MVTTSGYSTSAPVNGAGGQAASVDQPKKTEYWTLEQCKQSYLDYTGSKSLELQEIKEARRYRHHSQWTANQIETLNKRKQPVVTYPRIGRKIDGIVGTVERLKQDPKAYPRTPKQEQGADLATAALRYAMESQNWDAKTPIAADNCATDGHSGIELEVIQGDHDDNEVGFNLVEDGFFYDPRSFRLDFSDARYMGVSKLVDIETAVEMMPDKEEELRASTDTGGELATNSDRDNRWFTTIGKRKFIRLVDLWYMHKGGWCWSLYTGSSILDEGESYFVDEKKKTISKYLMFRCAVDQDGDSYGFVRALKSSQDEINQRRSKGLHILNTRRIIGEIGAFDDIEEARREAVRPDGFVLRNKGFEAEFDDQSKQLDLSGQLKFLEDAKAEIDNYGPSQVVTGQGVDGQSGRAIQLRQNAALAELGPFILSYRSWKLRVYRAVMAAIQKYWTGERWIRVTDDDGLAQFIQINGTQIDPMTGQSQIVNALGSLDVDIILDEGPDTINAMADTHDTLKEVLPAVAQMLSPQQAQAAIAILIETSALPSEAKKKFKDASQPQQQPPPDPALEMAKKLELAKSDAEAKDKAAAAGLKQAQTQKTIVETQLLPQKAAHDQAMDHTKMAHTAITDIQDRADDQQTQQMDMMRDHADRHQAAVFRGADMHDAEQARQFQGQQSEADRAAQQAAMQARMAQPQAAPA
jgi:hypothetical protein